MKNIIWFIKIGVYITFASCQNDMNSLAYDTSQAITIEIDHQKFQEIRWVDTNKIDFIFFPLDEEYPFGDIGKVIFRNQKIFIMPLGMDKIFIYTDRGEAIRDDQ